jgi:hypothetical protein
MPRRIHIFALAAMTLLAAAGADLLFVDFSSSFACDRRQAPGSPEQPTGDDCFCCCAHIIVPVQPVQIPAQPAQALVFLTDPPFLSPRLENVYHPPRA